MDALEGIRVEEVQAVSTEVRRSVTRHMQIVPKIAELVSEKRKSQSRSFYAAKPLAPEPPKPPQPPLSKAEIAKMPKYLKDVGLRVGFLKHGANGLTDTAS